MSSTSNINPKPCAYGCGIQIYWNNATNEYWEVFSQKKHLCPNRVNKSSSIATTTGTTAGTTTTTKPNYYTYNKFAKQPKPKMSNSFELLTGSIDIIQKKYEVLSDIVSEYNGKVHDSQSHIVGNGISLIVYYEAPIGQREEVKQKFNNTIRNIFA
jgi:hypothetical protein